MLYPQSVPHPVAVAFQKTGLDLVEPAVVRQVAEQIRFTAVSQPENRVKTQRQQYTGLFSGAVGEQYTRLRRGKQVEPRPELLVKGELQLRQRPIVAGKLPGQLVAGSREKHTCLYGQFGQTSEGDAAGKHTHRRRFMKSCRIGIAATEHRKGAAAFIEIRTGVSENKDTPDVQAIVFIHPVTEL